MPHTYRENLQALVTTCLRLLADGDTEACLARCPQGTYLAELLTTPHRTETPPFDDHARLITGKEEKHEAFAALAESDQVSEHVGECQLALLRSFAMLRDLNEREFCESLGSIIDAACDVVTQSTFDSEALFECCMLFARGDPQAQGRVAIRAARSFLLREKPELSRSWLHRVPREAMADQQIAFNLIERGLQANAGASRMPRGWGLSRLAKFLRKSQPDATSGS